MPPEGSLSLWRAEVRAQAACGEPNITRGLGQLVGAAQGTVVGGLGGDHQK